MQEISPLPPHCLHFAILPPSRTVQIKFVDQRYLTSISIECQWVSNRNGQIFQTIETMPSRIQQSVFNDEGAAPRGVLLAVSKLRDKQGTRIDRNIRIAVVAVRYFGFETTASCEGHLKWGQPFPWIDIGVHAEDAQRRTAGQHVRQHRRAEVRTKRRNLGEQQTMMEFLDAFYRNRQVPVWQRLIVVPIGVYGGFQLTVQGGSIQAAVLMRTRSIRLRVFQSEFLAFAHFLKDADPAIRLRRRRAGISSTVRDA